MERLARCFISSALSSIMVLGPTVALGASSPPRPTSTGVLVKIAIIPPASEDPAKSPLGGLADLINKDFPLYAAWVIGSGYCPLAQGNQCNPVQATILIHAASSAQTSHYSLRAINIVDGGVIANVADIDLSATPKDSDVSVLLGTPALANGRIVLNQSYQQFLQIVQAPTSNTDVDYAPVIAELLARRGVTAIRSSFTNAQLGAAPGSVICSNGEKYFVYSVSMTSNANFITGETRIGAQAGAFIADCASFTTIPFGGTDAAFLPTTGASLAAYVTLLSLGFPQWLKWTSVTQGALAFSKIVDVDPTSYIVRNDIATVALERGIDQMCQRLDIVAQLREQRNVSPGFPNPRKVGDLVSLDQFTPFSFPTPGPKLAPSGVAEGQAPKPQAYSLENTPKGQPQKKASAQKKASTSAGAGSTNQTSSAQTTGTASNPLDLTSFVGPSPPPLQCNTTNPRTVLAMPPPPSTPAPLP